ncbi:GntR family transcriptional regulator [Baekduia soli]|uniref:GntR family transcriptional regulator n=1 Tax=Baekduia soli TaxID=496014 RepID=A0A5B8U0L7_9ACTN|nr:GntR family transcriptional regulator [Baekduia soli]QEC46526.1 GntR family transcriptional regulator [Baekduia soli]
MPAARRQARPAPRPVRRRTLAVEVADSLRDMILTGELTAEQRMTQDELATLLGVSTMPVREALLRLAAEGFVEVSPSRSFSVVPTTREDVHDVFWMHATLAAELTRRACAKGDPALAARLRDIEACFAAARGAGDPAQLGAVNWEFHQAINEAAGAPKLLRVLRSTLRFIPQGFYALVPEWSGASEQGHEAIVRAFEDGDPDTAAHAAETHVQEAGEILIRFFTGRGAWTRPDGA